MSPQALTKKIVIAANEPGVNILAGLLIGQIPFDSAALTSIGLTGSAVGLVATINIGDTVAMQAGDLSAANRIPQMELDAVAVNIVSMPGSLVQIIISNTTGGALTCFVNVQQVPAQAQIVG